MAEEEKILIEVEIDNKAARKNEAELIALIERQRQELKLRRKELKDSNGTNKEAAKRVGELSRQIKSSSTQLRNEQKSLKANDNSINALRASVSKLTAERNNLDTSTEKGSKEFERLTKKMAQQTKQLKNLEGQVGDFRRNVGNYTGGIKEAFQATDLFGGSLGGLFGSFRELSGAIRSAIPLLKTLKTAMIALPILAVVAALTTLVSFLTQTRRGSQFIEKALKALEFTMGALVSEIAKLGEEIFDFGQKIFDALSEPKKLVTDLSNSVKGAAANFTQFAEDIVNAVSNPKKILIELGDAIKENLVNRLKSASVFVEALALAFEGKYAEAAKKAADASIQFATGVKNGTDLAKNLAGDLGDLAEKGFDYAKGKADDFSNSISNVVKEGFDLGEQNIKNRKIIREANLEIARQNRLAQEQLALSADASKSNEQRIAAAEQSIAAEKKISQLRISIAQAERRLIESEINGVGEATDEQLERRLQAIAKEEQAAATFARSTKRATNRLNKLRDDLAAEDNRRSQEAIQRNIDTLNAELLSIEEGSKEQLDKQIAAANAEAELAKNKAQSEITNAENLAARLKLIEAERLNAIKELKEGFSEAQQEAIDEAIQKQIAAAEKEKQIALEVAEAQQQKAQSAAEAAVQIGVAAAEEATTLKGAAKAVVNSVRDQVKAFLNKALAAQLAKIITTVPFPINLVIAGTATAALNLLFDKLVPGFATGGIVNNGISVNRSNGDNRLITAKTGEVVLNKSQRAKIGDSTLARAGVPGFATGGVIDGNNISSQITSNAVANDVSSNQSVAKSVIEGIRQLPSPVLDFKEFTTFTNRVTTKENRASV